jgi:hypothetical protein
MKTDQLKQFEAYYNGEMEPAEKDAFEALLKEDGNLKADFEEYLSIYEAIGDRETMDLRLKLKEIRDEKTRSRFGHDFFKHSYNWLWMAALLTIIISITVIVSLLISQPEMNRQIVTGIESIEPEKFSALDLELNKYARRNIEFNLYSPVNQLFINRKEPITFIWSVDSSDPLILELINWEGTVVYSSRKPVSSPFIVKKKFTSGIFVFRFRTCTEAYYMGLLFIR